MSQPLKRKPSKEKGIFEKVQTGLRQYQSGDRTRYQKLGLDLDLAYITPGLISMGFPSTGARSLLQNAAADVEVFFRRNHMNLWLIINCCNHNYTLESVSKENQIHHLGWAEGFAPTLSHLFKIITIMHQFLSQNPDHVVAVHGFNDQDRPGIVIACYLYYSGQVNNATEAVSLYNKQRGSSPTLKSPSHLRTIHNFCSFVDWSRCNSWSLAPLTSPPEVTLTRILMLPIPRCGLKREACKPFIQFYSEDIIFGNPTPIATHTSGKRFVGSGTITEDFVRVDMNVKLKGEVVIKVYHESKIAGMLKHDPLLRIHFHTSFQLGWSSVQRNWLDLHLGEIDEPHNATPLTASDTFNSSFRMSADNSFLCFPDL